MADVTVIILDPPEFNVETDTTGGLRWREGALEQEWIERTYDVDGRLIGARREWRAVPHVDAMGRRK